MRIVLFLIEEKVMNTFLWKINMPKRTFVIIFYQKSKRSFQKKSFENTAARTKFKKTINLLKR